mgnify:CR=1 FL=1
MENRELIKYDFLNEVFKDIYREENGIKIFKNFINGKWIESSGGKYLDIFSPINNEIVAKVQRSNKEDVEDAINSAFESRKKIREIAAIERIRILNKARHLMENYKEDFVKILMIEAGKTRDLAEGEFNTAILRIKLTMEDASKIYGEYIPGDWAEDKVSKVAIVLREPLGVIACISSFNYPLFSLVSKIVPALLAGNTVIAKPASDDPTVALLFVKILQEAGIPDGTLNLVTGLGGEVGDYIARNNKVQMITLTGSTATGKHVAEICDMKKLHLELGGKGAAIIANDADIQLAAKKTLEGSLRYSGQRCDSINRILILKDLHDRFLEEILKLFDSYKIGNPLENGTKIVPLINVKAADKVQTLVDDAIQKGAKLLRGGKHEKNYFEPTLLDDVPLNARIAWEETFGPVVVIIKVDTIDDAIEIVNKSNYGLDSCVFTNNLYTAWRVAKALEEGSVTINDFPSHGTGYFPFGGNKDSGLGREGIGYSLDEMTRIKTIQIDLTPLGQIKRISK